jgi:hypothetical protein
MRHGYYKIPIPGFKCFTDITKNISNDWNYRTGST